MSSLCKFLCLLLVLNCFAVIFAQREYCPSRDGKTRRCVSIYDCQPLLSLLRKPIPSYVTKYLKTAECGKIGKIPKVCCPQEDEEYTEPPPSLGRNTNLRLLPLDDCGEINNNRVLGGETTDVLEFPWSALLFYNTSKGVQPKCGGTIINSRYILTAAHCIIGEERNTFLNVRVGEHNLETEEDCRGRGKGKYCGRYQERDVEEFIPHPRYVGSQRGKNPRFQHDIGLLRLSQPINMSAENIMAVCLPVTRELRNLNIYGYNMTVIGWGATSLSAASSTVLLKVQVPVIRNSVCGDILNRSLDDGVGFRQVCSPGLGGKRTCRGDSGGPALIQHRLNQNFEQYIQFGISSFGYTRCESFDIPSVFTRVSHYMKWILSNLRP